MYLDCTRERNTTNSYKLDPLAIVHSKQWYLSHCNRNVTSYKEATQMSQSTDQLSYCTWCKMPTIDNEQNPELIGGKWTLRWQTHIFECNYVFYLGVSVFFAPAVIWYIFWEVPKNKIVNKKIVEFCSNNGQNIWIWIRDEVPMLIYWYPKDDKPVDTIASAT